MSEDLSGSSGSQRRSPSTHHGAACISCRRQGRKCDRTIPSCRACLDRGSLCEGYLLRWSTATSNPLSRKPGWTRLAHTRKSRRKSLSGLPFVSVDEASPDSNNTAADVMKKDRVPAGTTGGPSAIDPAVGCPLGYDIDSTAAIALLTASTHPYAIAPSSIPDGLGHLVNYGS